MISLQNDHFLAKMEYNPEKGGPVCVWERGACVRGMRVGNRCHIQAGTQISPSSRVARRLEEEEGWVAMIQGSACIEKRAIAI
jgi:hypothetical protein